jgi:hypothetical protein
MKALALTPSALFRLTQYSISEEWFKYYSAPINCDELKRVEVDKVVYIIEKDLEEDDGPLVVIDLSSEGGVFSDENTKVKTLDRVITVARSIYSTSVSIPTTWRRHQEGNLLSIQAPSSQRNWKARLHFNIRPNDQKDIFVFSRTEEIKKFNQLNQNLSLYRFVREKYSDAILSSGSPDESRAGIVLSQKLPQGFVQDATLDQWYDRKLTSEQRSFVDKKHDGPVRLRGAAGTGKTISLVIKFLRDAQLSEKAAEPKKFGFLTHSDASVDLVTSICESLDQSGLIYGYGKHIKLEVRTLYELANKYLNFSLDELVPLSLDGRMGRKLQAELIEGVLIEMADSAILKMQFSSISEELKLKWENTKNKKSRLLIAEIMNEFASVLDAEGIRAGEEKGERYAKATVKRASWLMNLTTEMDRRFILELHRRYRKHLSEMDTLSIDQMIGDFNSFLDSNRWDIIRDREGYDALFVDELHLFTSIERQTLHKLMKRNYDEAGKPNRPPIFMAYDLKQSPRDTFAQYGEADPNLFSASTGLQNSELVNLEKVFRYTPQIAEFLADIDASFPAIDIPGEWDAYVGNAALQDGLTPTLVTYRDEKSLFRAVFDKAVQVARGIDGGGRRVAVLCVNEELFDYYLETASGQYAGKHIPITSREPSSDLRHAGKRFVFSMPEYVAGLQFEVVFLIHVDSVELANDCGDGVRRRFISNIYLGASRAEKVLTICTCSSRGGYSDILRMAIERKNLIEITA